VTAGPRIVLVPGGFTGAWIWLDVVALLEREGIEALAVELPTIGAESAGTDFCADRTQRAYARSSIGSTLPSCCAATPTEER
jgi:hypothetical protein